MDIYLFETVAEAQEITDRWLPDYNLRRPPEALKNLSPLEFFRAKEGMPSLARNGVAV